MLSHLNFWSYQRTETPKVGEAEEDVKIAAADKVEIEDDKGDKFINTDKAKEWGNYFMEVGKSATSKAAQQVSSTAKHLRENVSKIAIVEQSNIISKFSDEQIKFKEEKRLLEKRKAETCLPWMEALSESEGDRQLLKTKVLSISTDERNFLRNPPAGNDFEFNYELHAPVAQLMLKEDEELAAMRYRLVPKRVKEETFWRNYFYRVSLLKASLQQTEADGTDGGLVGGCGIAETAETAVVMEPLPEVVKVTVAEGDDWEAELQKELLEFELVNEEAGGGDEARAEKADYDDIEREILDELEK